MSCWQLSSSTSSQAAAFALCCTAATASSRCAGSVLPDLLGRSDQAALITQSQIAYELHTKLIAVELLTHLYGHWLEVKSSDTDFITQQLVASRTTFGQWQPDSLIDQAAQGLEPWRHPSSRQWREKTSLANSAIFLLGWLTTCGEHDMFHRALTSKLSWLAASQIAGDCFETSASCLLRH